MTMGQDFRAALRPALVMLVGMTLLLGVAFPLVITGIGQGLFPHQANGSLIRDGGRVIGSELVGQGFADPRYFNTRPSAAGSGYDASASSGSNLGPNAQALVDRVRADLTKNGGSGPVPADLVTASGSGLDPHLSPAAALAQVGRVAAARGLPAAQVEALVRNATQMPLAGILGEPRVHVLNLNRQLDRIAPRPSGATARP